MGLGEILGDDVVSITGTPPDYVDAAAAETSKLITEHLNPPQRFPLDTTPASCRGWRSTRWTSAGPS